MGTLYEKYNPKEMTELFGNSSGIEYIVNWLSSYEVNKQKYMNMINYKKTKNSGLPKPPKKSELVKSSLLISGPHGCGKTTIIRTILNKYSYEVIHLSVELLKTDANIGTVVSKLISPTNIMDIIEKKRKKYVMVLDGIESIISSTEKSCVLSLQKYNDQEWLCPIIFISNSKHSKFITDISKASMNVKLSKPDHLMMKNLVIKVSKGENIKFSNKDVVDTLINYAQGDIRRLLTILSDLCEKDKTFVTMNTIMKYKEITTAKIVDENLFDSTDELLYSYKNIGECLRLFESEKVLLPLMVHENYIKKLNAVKMTNKRKSEILLRVTDTLSDGDIIENDIYGDQSWEMQEIHGFYTCVQPSFFLNENDKTVRTEFSEFAADLNKTSIKNINKNNISIANSCWPNANIFDYIYMNKILRKLINDNQMSDCIDYIKDYKITLPQLESLLKIDKITNNKIGLIAKQKTEFNNLMNTYEN